jgi:hypothetical protein
VSGNTFQRAAAGSASPASSGARVESLHVTAEAWAATLALVAGLFAIDLLVSGRRPHAVDFREAVGWSVFYVTVAVAFGIAFGVLAGWRYACSLDNPRVVARNESGPRYCTRHLLTRGFVLSGP